MEQLALRLGTLPLGGGRQTHFTALTMQYRHILSEPRTGLTDKQLHHSHVQE